VSKLMYSESHSLLCRVDTDGAYRVINGGWEGKRDGDRFVIQHTKKVLTITDWVEYSRSQFKKKYPAFGY